MNLVSYSIRYVNETFHVNFINRYIYYYIIYHLSNLRIFYFPFSLFFFVFFFRFLFSFSFFFFFLNRNRDLEKKNYSFRWRCSIIPFLVSRLAVQDDSFSLSLPLSLFLILSLSFCSFWSLFPARKYSRST